MPDEHPSKCSRIQSKEIDHDLRSRKQIFEFSINKQDEIWQVYLKKCLYQPKYIDYPYNGDNHRHQKSAPPCKKSWLRPCLAPLSESLFGFCHSKPSLSLIWDFQSDLCPTNEFSLTRWITFGMLMRVFEEDFESKVGFWWVSSTWWILSNLMGLMVHYPPTTQLQGYIALVRNILTNSITTLPECTTLPK